LNNEIKDILVKLLEGQTRLEGKVDGLGTEVKGLETEVKKNSIKLETIEKNINIIAELQTAHKEQYETLFKNTDALIEEKTDLIETAVKNVSKDVKEAKESIEVLKDMTGRHEVDINILKRRENVHKFV
jgi:predicted  nucleic acid-binding Zn-ribbon protein